MITTSSIPSTADGNIELAPSYTIPLVLVFIAIPLLILKQPIISLILALFGLFLLYQTVTLRLLFTQTDLEIYRQSQLIRRFPYEEWQNWRIFSPSFPVLFYFKEVKSIHFLPILFDPKMLKIVLENRCPRQD